MYAIQGKSGVGKSTTLAVLGALDYPNKGTKASAGQIEEYLKAVGISDEIARRNVRKMSGGEQQRIAIARALAMDSKIILADEPTGNLNLVTAEEIIDILYEMASEQGKCVIAVTHTPELAQRADVVLHIVDKCLGEAVEERFSDVES